MIRVLVVDDHAVVRAGLEQVLGSAEDIEVVGAASNGDEAIVIANEREPDVVLMDLSMPDLDGIAATRALADAAPSAQIVVLACFSDRQPILAALDAGAIGYLLKDAEPADLMAGIRTAARGESPLAPKAASALILAWTGASPARDLSDREREVLALVSSGMSNKVIARELGISEKTVKAHLTSIFRRIGVGDRVQAVLWARQHGIVEH
jgi:DNA-binding NarL/FixJ family response regulator